VPQPRLAEELRATSVLAYPNTYPETSCIAVLEAIAAGCVVVTSERGALPETMAGFGRLVPIEGDRDTYIARFVKETMDVLREQNWEQPLQKQIQHVRKIATWPERAREWTEWLSRSLV
jgi:glycosyltransferase involved in cell wall biosynthesis